MKHNKTAYFLTGFIALGVAAYMPQANATVLSPSSATAINSTVSAGPFQDVYSFVIDNGYSNYNLSGSFSFQTVQTLASQTANFNGAVVTSSSGITNATVELLNSSASVIATGVLSSFSVASAPTLVTLPFPGFSPFYQELLTTYNTLILNNIPVIGSGSYKVSVKGDSNGGTYTGNLNVSPIVPVAIPLPSAAWTFITGVLGLLSIRRRNNLAHFPQNLR